MKKLILLLLSAAITCTHAMAMEEGQTNQQQVVPYQGPSAFYTIPKDVRNTIALYLTFGKQARENLLKSLATDPRNAGMGLHNQQQTLNAKAFQLLFSNNKDHGTLAIKYKQGVWPITQILHNQQSNGLAVTHCNVSPNEQFAVYLKAQYTGEDAPLIPHSIHVVDMNTKKEIKKIDMQPFLGQSNDKWSPNHVELSVNRHDSTDDHEKFEKEREELKKQGYVEEPIDSAERKYTITTVLRSPILGLAIDDHGKQVAFAQCTESINFNVSAKTMHKTSVNLSYFNKWDAENKKYPFNLAFIHTNKSVVYGNIMKNGIINGISTEDFDTNKDMLEKYFNNVGVCNKLESQYQQ